MRFPKTLLFAALVAAAPVAVCGQTVGFNNGGTQSADGNGAEPYVAFNPAGTKIVVVYGEPNTYVDAGTPEQEIEVDILSVADGSELANDTLLGSETGYGFDDGGSPDSGEITCAWSPDGSTIVVGWGQGDDGGVAFQIYSYVDGTDTLTRTGSVVDIADGVEDPRVDFFSDGTFLIGYEGGEGLDGSGAMMRHFATAGTELTTGSITMSSSITGDQNDPNFAILRSGTFANDIIYTAWEDSGTTRYAGDDDVNYRIFDSAFNSLSGPTAPAPASNLSGADKIGNPSVAVAPTGEWTIAFEAEGSPDNSAESAWASFFDNTNTPVTNNAVDIDVNNTDVSQSISIQYNADNNKFVFAWTTEGNTDGAPVRLFDLDGTNGSMEYDFQDVNTFAPKDGCMDLSGNKIVFIWSEDADEPEATDANGIFYRFGDIEISADVNDWGRYN